jgi:hypothetical protein
MNLREEILKEHSKAQCRLIVAWIGGSQKRFDELFDLFLKDEYRVVQRAAWPVGYCVEAHPALIKKHFARLISNFHKPKLHDAVKRNSIRLLQFVVIPEKYQGEMMNLLFNYLASPTEAVAVKVYSMMVLVKLARVYPEIIPELNIVIEDQIEQQTAAFKSCAKKSLKEINPKNI